MKVKLEFSYPSILTVRYQRLILLGVTMLLLLSNATITKAQELTDVQQRGMHAFARAFGFVRFHPSDGAIKADWTKVAIEGTEQVLLASSNEELIQALERSFAFAPQVRFGESDFLKEEIINFEPNSQLRYWQHRGYDPNASKWSIFHSILKHSKSLEDSVSLGFRLDKSIKEELVDGISIVFPLAVKKTKLKLKDLPTFEKVEALNRNIQLAGVVIAWNQLEYFFPYWDVVDVDWSSVLDSSLLRAAMDTNDLQYQQTLNRMLLPLKDGHGMALNLNRPKWVKLDVQATIVENKIIVENCIDCEKLEINLGDEIVEIDGRPAIERYVDLAKNKSGSLQLQKRFATSWLLGYFDDRDSMQLSLKNEEEETYFAQLPLKPFVWNEYIFKYKSFEEIEPGIFYVSLDRISDKELKGAMKLLNEAKGVIFELKYYPNVGEELYQHLADYEMTSQQWERPIVNYPHEKGIVDFDTTGRWKLKPKRPFLGDKKIVFITSGRAISAAESYLGIVEHYKLGSIVSEEPTAGANGNTKYIELPGNFQLIYTAMKVLKHDGSQLHTIGILPTHPIKRTVEGIRAGRDELIEEALRIIKN